MSKSKGTSDEAIGRPKPWREGRYQQPGKSVDETVDTTAKPKQQPEAPKSTPVTRKDYEQR
jgi:hypothetical protein